MRHVRNKFALMVTLGGLLLATVACENRDNQAALKNPHPVLTVDDSVVATLDPAYSGANQTSLTQASPSDVTINPSVTRSALGNGYSFQLTWSYNGTAPSWWTLAWYSDRNDGSGLLDYSGGDICQNDNLSDSRLLSVNRVYKVELKATVSGQGDVRYKSITIDLRGLF